MSQSHDFPAVHIPEFDQADRMKKALRDARMSTTAMAEFLGITRETAGRYMSGAAKVPLQTLRLWSLRTGVPMEWLTDGIVPEDVATEEPPAKRPAKRKTAARGRSNRSLDYKPDSVKKQSRPPDPGSSEGKPQVIPSLLPNLRVPC